MAYSKMKIPDYYQDCKNHAQQMAWMLSANGIKVDKVRMSKFGGAFIYFTTKSGYKTSNYFTKDDVTPDYSEIIDFMRAEIG